VVPQGPSQPQDPALSRGCYGVDFSGRLAVFLSVTIVTSPDCGRIEAALYRMFFSHNYPRGISPKAIAMKRILVRKCASLLVKKEMYELAWAVLARSALGF